MKKGINMKIIHSKGASKTKKKSKNMNSILAESLFITRTGTIDSKYFAIAVISAIFINILIHTAFTGKISTGINFLFIILFSECIHKMRTKDGRELQLWQKVLMLGLVASGIAFLSSWLDYYMGHSLVQNIRNWMGWK